MQVCHILRLKLPLKKTRILFLVADLYLSIRVKTLNTCSVIYSLCF